MDALVLGGGNALGAYHGGVTEALMAHGIELGWVAGSSIGAVCAALIAGNARERRVAALREFWRRAAQIDVMVPWLPPLLRAPFLLSSASEARLLGRPSLFQPRFGTGPGYFTAAPMRTSLLELVDWDRLNGGATRVSMLTVDLATGEEVAFDTARERVTVDHVLASAALIPDFDPVQIGERVLVDGGLSANVPADLILAERFSEPLALYVADPFPGAAPLPVGQLDALARHADLLFAAQTRRTLRAMERLWRDRAEEDRDAAPGSCYWMEYEPRPEEELPLKGYGFSQAILNHRWVQGRRDAERAIALRHTEPPSGRGLRVHPPIRASVTAGLLVDPT